MMMIPIFFLLPWTTSGTMYFPLKVRDEFFQSVDIPEIQGGMSAYR